MTCIALLRGQSEPLASPTLSLWHHLAWSRVAIPRTTIPTQAIAAAAQFLEFDALIVPSARSPALHLVIFLESVLAEGALTVLDSEPVDWSAWRSRR